MEWQPFMPSANRACSRPTVGTALHIIHDYECSSASKSNLSISQSLMLVRIDVRLVDGTESMMNGISPGAASLLVGFESSVDEHVADQLAKTLRICKEFNGAWQEDVGTSTERVEVRDERAEAWKKYVPCAVATSWAPSCVAGIADELARLCRAATSCGLHMCAMSSYAEE